jgi:hypothetical protein
MNGQNDGGHGLSQLLSDSGLSIPSGPACRCKSRSRSGTDGSFDSAAGIIEYHRYNDFFLVGQVSVEKPVETAQFTK